MTDDQIVVLVFGIFVIVILLCIIVYYGGKRWQNARNPKHYHYANDNTRHYVGRPTEETLTEL